MPAIVSRGHSINERTGHARQHSRDPDRHRDQGARRARDADAGDPRGARAQGGRGVDPDRRRRRQSCRLSAAHGALPDAARGSGYPRSRMFGRRGEAGRGGDQVAGRGPGLRADGRRRLWRICHRSGGPMPAGAGRGELGRCRRPARDVLHSVDECVRADAPANREVFLVQGDRAASGSPQSSSPRRSAPRSWPPPGPTRNAGRVWTMAPML